MAELLYSVGTVLNSSGYLELHDKYFFNIPAYQRGYKWKRKDVKILLNDINSFKPKDGKFDSVALTSSEDKST